jgi:hypothetical protein
LDEFEFVTHEFLAAPDDKQDIDAEDGLEFQLFASTSRGGNPAVVSKIRLKSPSPDDAEPGLVNPERDRSYYFAGAPTHQLRKEFQESALSGEAVVALSHTLWPGMAYAWKVLHIPSTQRQRLLLARAHAPDANAAPGISSCSKRKRPGKKARLALRIGRVAEEEKRVEMLKEAEAKEAAEREKRARRNREKKLKKKIREKAKKANAGAEAGSDVEMEEDD